MMIGAAMGVKRLVERWPARRGMVGNLCLVAVVVAGGWRLPYWAGMLAHNSNEILTIDVAMGEWLAANTPPGAVIAVDDIGAIAFLSERQIVDLNGLVSPEMWPILRQHPVGRGRDQATTRLLSAGRLDYLAIFPTWNPDLAANAGVLTPVQTFHVATGSIIGATEAAIYRANWPYLATAAPAVERRATLGETIQLLGYDLAATTSPAPALELTLFWESVAPVTKDYDVFIHLLDAAGSIVAQADSQPVASLAPTSLWQPGDIVRDPYHLALPADLAPGRYRLTTGMYWRETGARQPASGGSIENDAIGLTTFKWP
jgi:hypothetical protein